MIGSRIVYYMKKGLSMKFLHISDIHFDPVNDGFATRNLRNIIGNYFREKNIVNIDEIFFTGDFRHAWRQRNCDADMVAKNAVDFLIFIAGCVGVNDLNHIHIVPGNHDLDRVGIVQKDGTRILDERILDEIYQKYDIHKGKFDYDIQAVNVSQYLKSRFSFFEKCVNLLQNRVWGNFQNNSVHRVKQFENYSIIFVNSAIASGNGAHKHDLIIQLDEFYSCVLDSGKKPLIILSHNPLEHIREDERVCIKNILIDNNMPVLWLSGDTHSVQYDNSFNIANITVGCMLKESGTDAAFYVGDISDNFKINISAYKYVTKALSWTFDEGITKRVMQAVERISYPNIKEVQDIYEMQQALSSKMGRFNYISENTHFYGRTDEIKLLDAFCQNEESFLWWMILGEGGSGKSRLAYEFGKKIASEGWCVLYPKVIDFNNLTNFICSIKKNILCIIDYFTWHKIEVGRIIDFMSKTYTENRIRFILIERSINNVNEIINQMAEECDTTSYLKSSLYNGNYICLAKMDDSILKKIIKSYSQSRQFLLTEEDVEKVLLKLKKIDCKKERPLFAIIVADLFGEKNDSKQENIEDILTEILNKEEKRLRNNIRNYYRKTNKINKIIRVCKLFLLAGLLLKEKATEETIKKIFAKEWKKLEEYIELVDFSSVHDLLVQLEIVNENKCVEAITPDLLGEFYFAKNANNQADVVKLLEVSKEEKSAKAFLNMLYIDFKYAWAQNELLRNIGEIYLGGNIQEIPQYMFSNCNFLEHIVIPQGVKSIGMAAFSNCKNLQSVEFPSSLRVIETGAFASCSKIEKISIPYGTISIRPHAFIHCNPKEISIPSSVQQIGSYAFAQRYYPQEIWDDYKNNKDAYYLYDWKYFWYTEEKLRENTIGEAAFAQYKGKINLRISPRIKFISDRAFVGCIGLQTINFSNIYRASMDAFGGCINLKVKKARDIGCLWSNTQVLKALVDNDIPDQCFFGCSFLKKIYIKEGIKKIGNEAFGDCRQLEKLVIPESVERLGSDILEGCCNLKVLVIKSEKINGLPEQFFLYCTSLKIIVIRRKLKICFEDFRFFKHTPKIIFLDNKCSFKEDNAVIYSVNKEKILFGKREYRGKVIIPVFIKKINEYAFCNCQMSEVDIEANVDVLGTGTFRNCINLQQIKFPPSIKIISDHAFEGCTSLKYIDLQKCNCKIEAFAFANCISLEEVILPENITYIPHGTFVGCKNLRKVVYPPKCEISTMAFEGYTVNS